MHTLIITPNILQGSTLSFALKRHNFSSLIVSPFSLAHHPPIEADGLVFPHPLVKDQWNFVYEFLKEISPRTPLIFFHPGERRYFQKNPYDKLLRQCIFLDPSTALSQMPLIIQEILQKSTPKREMQVGPLLLDRMSRRVVLEGHQIDLSRKEFFLLELFLLNCNRIISRDFIIDYVWDRRDYVAQNTIDVYVSRLRKKIHPLSKKPLIRTIPCLGYQLDI